MSLARKERQSLQAQRDALINTGCDPNHIYVDTISGAKWSRPGLNAALGHMQPNDTLVVTHLDRLGRNLVETVTTIADLTERSINVKVLEPALDTSMPAGKVVVDVMMSLAKWERDLLAQRTRKGVARARAKGKVAGPRPKLSTEQKHLARDLVGRGKSVSSVARSLGVSRQTIYRAIQGV